MTEWGSKVSLLFLLVIALIGTWIRSLHLIGLPFPYGNMVHAHSHVAFQGWVYTIQFLILTKLFLSKEQKQNGRYVLQFKLTILVVVGILISFTLQGYAFYSLVFSTLFQLLNYWFIYSLFRDLKENKAHQGKISVSFIKTGLWLGILSSIVPLVVGILTVKGMNDTALYESLIYTFLHLQYNGWFLFVVLGLFFKLLEDKTGFKNSKNHRWFYRLLTFAVIPAIFLSFIGLGNSLYIRLPAYMAALAQVVAVYLIIPEVLKKLPEILKGSNTWFRIYLLSFIASFFLKVCLQFLSIFPLFEALAFQNKNVILAYMHLCLIGVISFALLSFMVKMKLLMPGKLSGIGHFLWYSGFITTELKLVLSGISIFHSIELLISGSCAMAMGILLLLISPKGNMEYVDS